MNWIQGDKFMNIADLRYAPTHRSDDDYCGLVNTFYEKRLKDVLEQIPDEKVEFQIIDID
jgi:predicted proteasome-type protease